MSKHYNVLSILCSILFLTSLTNTNAASSDEFNGVKCRFAEDMEKLEKQCPTLTATWVEGKKMHTRLRELPFIFGTTVRPTAEKEFNALLPKYNSLRKKLSTQAEACTKKLKANVTKTSKKLAPLKNPSSDTLKKRKKNLQEELADKKKSLATAEKIKKSLYVVYRHSDLQRVRADMSGLARTQMEKKYPNMVKLRTTAEDNIADIKRYKTTDPKKLNKSQMLLKSNYNKLQAMGESKKKLIAPKAEKLTKELAALNKKIEQAEKANRKTDRLDEKHTTVMMSRNTFNAEIMMIDKLVKIPNAEKLIN